MGTRFRACTYEHNVYGSYECRSDFRVQPATECPPWVVLVHVSEGVAALFDNWLIYFRALRLPNQLVVVAEDAYTRRRYADVGIVLDGWARTGPNAHDYDTPSYHRLVSLVPSYVQRTLQMYPHVVYSDLDALWVRNPLPHLVGSCDVWGAVDDVLDGRPYICTGWLAFSNTSATHRTVEEWRRRLARRPRLNQPTFNRVATHTAGLQLCALPRDAFPSGRLFFATPGFNRSRAHIVHNNFIQGTRRKIGRFKTHGLWAT